MTQLSAQIARFATFSKPPTSFQRWFVNIGVNLYMPKSRSRAYIISEVRCHASVSGDTWKSDEHCSGVNLNEAEQMNHRKTAWMLQRCTNETVKKQNANGEGGQLCKFNFKVRFCFCSSWTNGIFKSSKSTLPSVSCFLKPWWFLQCRKKCKNMKPFFAKILNLSAVIFAAMAKEIFAKHGSVYFIQLSRPKYLWIVVWVSWVTACSQFFLFLHRRV